MSDNHENNAFLTSMSQIPDLNERLRVWQPLIEQETIKQQNNPNPAIDAYQANYVLHKIISPTSTHISFKGTGFDVKLFLTLFKSEYQKHKICPTQAAQYMSVLSQAGYFNQKDLKEIQDGLLKLEPVSQQSLSAISVFNSINKPNEEPNTQSPIIAA